MQELNTIEPSYLYKNIFLLVEPAGAGHAQQGRRPPLRLRPFNANAALVSARAVRAHHFLEQKGLRKMITLRKTDPRSPKQVCELLKVFDALGQNGYFQCMTHGFNRLENALAARALMDVDDERSVDLDFIGGDIREDGSGGRARSEVVDRYANPIVTQQRQHLRLKLILCDESVFGHFDDETFRASACLEITDQRMHERQIACLPGRNVDGNGLARSERLIQPIDRADRVGHDEMRDRIDQPKLGRPADEREGRLEFSIIIAPAYQCFNADHLLSANVYLGLERAA